MRVFFFFFPSQLFLLHRSSLFGNFYNKVSHMMPSSKDQSKRSITKQMSPALAAQLEGLWKESTSHNNRFHEPEMQQITKVGVQVRDSSKCKCTFYCYRRASSRSRGTLSILATTIYHPQTPLSYHQRSSRSSSPFYDENIFL